jgi:Flp pilus assembly protein TadG
MLHRFFKNERGNVLMLTGLGIIILFAAGGAAVDFGRQQLVRSKLQQATDAAALAAAAMPAGATVAERTAVANRYYELNYPAGYLGVARPTPSINIGADISVSATTNVGTNFVSNVGVASLQSAGSTRVSVQAGAKTDYDVVVVVDESGSTLATDGGCGRSRTRMDCEKEALNLMLDSIYPANANPDVRVGVIGYTGSITTHGPLTSNKATAKNYVNMLQGRCQNFDHWGLSAGHNMITGTKATGYVGPSIVCNQTNWLNYIVSRPPKTARQINYFAAQQNDAVGTPATPRSDGRSYSTVKNMILLGDGQIMREPDPSPSGADVSAANAAVFNAECTKIKNAGVTLYVVNFVSTSPSDEAALRQCASVDEKGVPRYFYAPNATELKKILTAFAETIRKVRIAE